LAKEAPDVTELYLPGVYKRVPVEPMTTARRSPYRLLFDTNRENASGDVEFRYRLKQDDTSWTQEKGTSQVTQVDDTTEVLSFRFPPNGRYSLEFLHSGAAPLTIFSGVPWQSLEQSILPSAFAATPEGERDIDDEVLEQAPQYADIV
jgi:hypothetical protein